MSSKPYTYLIGWSKHRTYYYGVRFANGCHPFGKFESLNEATIVKNVNFSTISYRINSNSDKFKEYKRVA